VAAIDRTETLAVFAGGVAGAVLRTILVRHIHHAATEWPWATFIANVGGSFVLGAVAWRFPRGPGRSGAPRAVLGTGFCGALTTFSTLQVELVLMLAAGSAGLAVGYGAASVCFGLLAVWAGDRLARWERSR
jgi:CrcB protein